MEGRLLYDFFVDGFGGVDHRGLDDFAFDDGLHGFVHVVVDVLAREGAGGGGGFVFGRHGGGS